MVQGMTTYCDGFNFKPITSVTKSDLIHLTVCLGEVFGEGWKFEPEAITEGGIVVEDWPGKTPLMYKSMRFHYGVSARSKWRWPSVPDEHRLEWEHSNEVVWHALSKHPRKDWCNTWIKAFHYAPPWTVGELRKVAGVLAEFGIATRKMPSKPQLSRH